MTKKKHRIKGASFAHYILLRKDFKNEIALMRHKIAGLRMEMQKTWERLDEKNERTEDMRRRIEFFLKKYQGNRIEVIQQRKQ